MSLKITFKILLKLTGDQYLYIHELVQEIRNSIANALELRLSCNNPQYIIIWPW